MQVHVRAIGGRELLEVKNDSIWPIEQSEFAAGFVGTVSILPRARRNSRQL